MVMIIELNEDEKNIILRCFATTIVAAGVDHALQASADLLPLAARISQMKDVPKPKGPDQT